MRIERAGDLIFWTYHMLDWGKVRQYPSGQRCVQCGSAMVRVGPMEDARGAKYDGLACHRCKRVVWVKSA
ncbi:MAG TPA: hypothetical protein VKF15_01940 [Nitrososphaerales archaeon]|nr:hypothetical protein [Nitrososphaerales archaeon]